MDVAPPKSSVPHVNDFHGEEHITGVAAGRLPEEVYTNTLPSWRAALRRKCVAVVEWESEVIVNLQVRLSPHPSLSLRDAQTMGEEEEFSINYGILCL